MKKGDDNDNTSTGRFTVKLMYRTVLVYRVATKQAVPVPFLVTQAKYSYIPSNGVISSLGLISSLHCQNV
jgi:hypothetical protein